MPGRREANGFPAEALQRPFPRSKSGNPDHDFQGPPMHPQQPSDALQAVHQAALLPGSVARHSAENYSPTSAHPLSFDSATSIAWTGAGAGGDHGIDGGASPGNTFRTTARSACCEAQRQNAAGFLCPRSGSPGDSPRLALAASAVAPAPAPPPGAGGAPAFGSAGAAPANRSSAGDVPAAGAADPDPVADPNLDSDPRWWALRGRPSADGAAARFDALSGRSPWGQPAPEPYPQSHFLSPVQRRLDARAQAQLQTQRGLQPHPGGGAAFSDLLRADRDASVGDAASPLRRRDSAVGVGLGLGGRARQATYYRPAPPAAHVHYDMPTPGREQDGNGQISCGGGGGGGAVGDGARVGEAARAAQRSGASDGSSPGLLRRLMRALVSTTPRSRTRVSCDGGVGGGGGAVPGTSGPLGAGRGRQARHWRSWTGSEGISASDVGSCRRSGGGGGADGDIDGDSVDSDAALQAIQSQRHDSRLLHRARLGLLGERPQSALLTPPPPPPLEAAPRPPVAAVGSSAAGRGLGRDAAWPPSPASAAVSVADSTSPPMPSRTPIASAVSPKPPKLPAAAATESRQSYCVWGLPDAPPAREPRPPYPASAPTSLDLGDGGREKAPSQPQLSSVAAMRARLVPWRRNPGGDAPDTPPSPLSPAAAAVREHRPSSPPALQEQSRCLSEPVAVLASTRSAKRLAIAVEVTPRLGGGGGAGAGLC